MLYGTATAITNTKRLKGANVSMLAAVFPPAGPHASAHMQYLPTYTASELARLAGYCPPQIAKFRARYL